MVTLIQTSNRQDAKMAKQVAEMREHGFRLRELYRKDEKLFYVFVSRRGKWTQES